MKTFRAIILFFGLFASTHAWGHGATSKYQIDSITNSTGGSALAVPSTGSNVVSDSASQTLTNKTINCANNTCSQVPVSAAMVQEVPSGSCNGSNTTLTLAHTPGGSASVMLHIDGLIQTQGAGKDYTISGATITLATACASGQTPYAVYSQY
jgi:hypothetical protein